MARSHLKGLSVPVPDVVRTCAIVVLFHPDAGFGERLRAICGQFPRVVLVDNTPEGATLAELPDTVRLLANGRNLGIATALNQGLACAQLDGCTWAASFDQDTDVGPDYLESVVAIAARYAPVPSLVGANYTDHEQGRVAHLVPSGAGDVCSRLTLITSGTFMPVDFAVAIGGFRDDYFIDSVDHEFCLRAGCRGARVLLTSKPYMRHRMGNGGARLGLRLSFQHPPVRRYYIARNTLLTARANALRHPAWAFRQAGRLVGEGVAIMVLEQDRSAKMRAFARGLWHGLIGRSDRRE